MKHRRHLIPPIGVPRLNPSLIRSTWLKPPDVIRHLLASNSRKRCRIWPLNEVGISLSWHDDAVPPVVPVHAAGGVVVEVVRPMQVPLPEKQLVLHHLGVAHDRPGDVVAVFIFAEWRRVEGCQAWGSC